ncbi:MAG: hypothetical protein P8Y45_12530 [Exilibacterium sp.]
MSSPNVTLRISGSLREHLDECTGPNGLYETPSEYLRDLIRRDMEQKDAEKWERLRAALAEGLSAKESDYQPVSAEEIKQRARKRHGISS